MITWKRIAKIQVTKKGLPKKRDFKKFDEESLLLEDAAGKTLNVIPVYDRVPKDIRKR